MDQQRVGVSEKEYGGRNSNKDIESGSQNDDRSTSYRGRYGYGKEIIDIKNVKIKNGDKETSPPLEPRNLEFQSNFIESMAVMSFEEMNLKDEVMRGILKVGFEAPSEIQTKAITPIMKGLDVVAQARSGTGKTATFVIGMINRLNPELTSLQAVVIAPTRELAQQIEIVFSQIASKIDIISCLCIGGMSTEDQIRKIKQGVQVIIGTTGRIYGMVTDEIINLKTVQIMVLDEADELLKRGFQLDIYSILNKLNRKSQIVLMSATIPLDVLMITNKFMTDPVRILVEHDKLTLDGIRQYLVHVVDDNSKVSALVDIYKNMGVSQCIIFCSSIITLKVLYKKLTLHQFECKVIHSELSQKDRFQIMTAFRNSEIRILLASDLISRGIDVQQVNLVINFEVPNNIESYLHRIGRCGRYGRNGLAINFITNDDIYKIREIESFYNTTISALPANLKEVFK